MFWWRKLQNDAKGVDYLRCQWCFQEKYESWHWFTDCDAWVLPNRFPSGWKRHQCFHSGEFLEGRDWCLSTSAFSSETHSAASRWLKFGGSSLVVRILQHRGKIRGRVPNSLTSTNCPLVEQTEGLSLVNSKLGGSHWAVMKCLVYALLTPFILGSEKL